MASLRLPSAMTCRRAGRRARLAHQLQALDGADGAARRDGGPGDLPHGSWPGPGDRTGTKLWDLTFITYRNFVWVESFGDE